MQLHYTSQSTIGEIERQFSAAFSNLKMEFLSGRPLQNVKDAPVSALANSVRLRELNNKLSSGNIYFYSSMSIVRFQEKVEAVLGLPIQIYRKASDLWIEIHQTENLSLAQHQKLGHTSQKSYRFNVNTLFL